MSHDPQDARKPPNLAPVEPDHLNGWKEIASFLGKGVRTVQRWEREYGLPAHRLGRQGGEIVWASRRELGEWLRAHGPRVPANDADRDAAPTAESDAREPRAQPAPAGDSLAAPPSPSRPTTRSRESWQRPWLVSALAYGTAAALILWASLSLIKPAATEPVSWEMKGQRFTVVDRDGRVMFFKDFTFIQDADYSVAKESRVGGKVVFADLDGDGTKEVLFGAAGSHFPSAMGLFVYGADGGERFVVRPQQQVTFGSKTYVGPWMPYRLFVIGEGADLSILTVFIGADEFPSLLLELDGRGNVRSEYLEQRVHRVGDADAVAGPDDAVCRRHE